MTSNTQMNPEIGEFFAWLKTQLPEPREIEIPAPSPELLELAWQAAQAHQQSAKPPAAPSAYRERITLLAASDGKINEKGLRHDGLLGGDCSLTVEYIPDDPAWKIVKVKFSEHRIPEFQGRRITVGIAGQEYDLGEVNRRGIAEAEIPGNLVLAQLEFVDYGKPLDSET